VIGRFLPWLEDPVLSGALFWEWHVRLARRAGSQLGAHLYHEMRYEALVSRPAEECAALCAFLGLPFSDRMLLAERRRGKVRAGADSKHSRLPPTPGIRSWRSQLAADDAELFEAISGDLLDELGYERRFAQPSGILAPARRFRERYAAGLPNGGQTWSEE
jgi:hypothetical protein